MMKLRETRNRETIVSEEFKDLVSANALSGLRLDPVMEIT